ncbi:MAG TPA: hypothetical protein VGR92_08065 [Steroidobacteraceae bacterium]|nr:hypothetical protein [Steroidobacteraceae bacterium]
MRIYRGAGSLRSVRSLLPALFGLLVGTGAYAQTAVVTTVHTVTAAGQPPAVEHDFSVQNAGTYTVTVVDLGAKLSPAAPLSSVAMAVTQGTTIVGTPGSVTAAGTPVTITATAAGTYTIHVVGTQGSTLGSGPIEEDVTDSGGNRIFSSVDNLSAAAQQPSGVGFVDDSFTVSSSAVYTVSMTDLQFPAALQTVSPNNPQLILVDSTTGTLVASLTSFGSTPTTSALNPGDTYDILAVVQQGSANGGLFSVSVTAASTAAYGPRIVPVGEVALLQSSASGQTQSTFSLTAATSTTLSLKDLAFPNAPLTAVGAALVDETAQQPIATVSGTAQQTVTTPGTADTYQVFAYAVADNTVNSGGSYSVTVQQGSFFPFDEAQAVSSTSSTGVTVQAFNLDTSVAATAPYVFTLTDFKFPAALATAALAAVQNGQLLGSVNAAGNFTENVNQGPVTLLAFAEEGSAGQSAGSSPGLLGIDLSPKGGGAALFDVTEGIGAGFSSTSFTVPSGESVQANVADLQFPAALQNLNLAVTSGTTLVGSIVSAGSSGSFPFTASASTTYNVNILAQPATSAQGASQKYEAGTYAMSVDPAPAVTLTASSASVASGGTVSLSWTATNATSCTASASPSNSAWNGSESPSGGPVTTSAITATTTFSLSCTGGGGSANASATVTVAAASSGGGKGGGGALDLETLLALAALAALRWRDSRRSLSR